MTSGTLTAAASFAMGAVAPMLGYTPQDAKFATEKGMEYIDMAISEKLYKPKAQTPR